MQCALYNRGKAVSYLGKDLGVIPTEAAPPPPSHPPKVGTGALGRRRVTPLKGNLRNPYQ